MENVKKMIHEAEVNRRISSVRDPARAKSPVDRKKERTVNLNINNYKISFRQLGNYVIQ